MHKSSQGPQRARKTAKPTSSRRHNTKKALKTTSKRRFASKSPSGLILPSPSSALPQISSAFKSSTPAHGMSMDPLSQWNQEKVHMGAPYTFMSSRSAGEPITVLLVGYHSHIGQHLYTHLQAYGFNVHPVAREAVSHRNWTQVIPIHLIQEHGLPDVDFIINCQGLNAWNPKNDADTLYNSRVGTNKFWADQIRKTSAKPYAYITMSSVFQFPPSNETVYDDSYRLPAMSSYLRSKDQCDAFDVKHGFTATQKMFRDSETHSRVFIPELDQRTDEQLEELRRVKQQYDLEHLKSEVYTERNVGDDPERQRRRSVRHQLLTNDQVRVVNMRHGLLFSQKMQEMKHAKPFFDNGQVLNQFPTDAQLPGMHMDDFCSAIIHAMTNHKISGAVNAVLPESVENHQVLEYVARMNRYWMKSGVNSRSSIDQFFGTEQSTRLLHTRLVEPKKLKESGFQWRYPTWEDVRKSGPSIFEHEIIAHGTEGLDRNSELSIFH